MQPHELREYLEGIARRLDELGGTPRRPLTIRITPEQDLAILDSLLSFDDDSSLSVRIVAVGPANFPDWLDYRFHFMDALGGCIFRYDNSRYHQTTAHFPHHKHVGPDERVIDHRRPSIADVIREVQEHLAPGNQ